MLAWYQDWGSVIYPYRFLGFFWTAGLDSAKPCTGAASDGPTWIRSKPSLGLVIAHPCALTVQVGPSETAPTILCILGGGTPALSTNKKPKAQDSPKTSHNLSPGDTCFSHSSTDAYGLGVGCPGRDRQSTGMCDDEPHGRLVACHAQGSRRQGPTPIPTKTQTKPTKTKIPPQGRDSAPHTSRQAPTPYVGTTYIRGPRWSVRTPLARSPCTVQTRPDTPRQYTPS